jgi:hypothetical protein
VKVFVVSVSPDGETTEVRSVWSREALANEEAERINRTENNFGFASIDELELDAEAES